MAESEGASPNEQLLAASKTDNEEMLLAVLEEEESFEINYQDGLGNTALHYAASYGSVTVLDHLLEVEDCDVDLQNRLLKETPLHLAAKISDKEIRAYVIHSLLDAGADTKMLNKNGQTVLDLLSLDDEECRKYVRDARAEEQVSQADIASDDDDDAVGDANSDVASD